MTYCLLSKRFICKTVLIMLFTSYKIWNSVAPELNLHFFPPNWHLLTASHCQLMASSMTQVSRSKILELSLGLLFLPRPIFKWSPKLVISAFTMSLTAIAISTFQLPCHKRPKQLSLIWITVITSSLVSFLRKFNFSIHFLTALPSESSSLFEIVSNSIVWIRKSQNYVSAILNYLIFGFLKFLTLEKVKVGLTRKSTKRGINSLYLMNKFLFINNACTILRHYFINT